MAFWDYGRDNNFMSDLRVLASHATQRGRDSSGLMTFDKDYSVVRAEYSLSQLIKNVELQMPVLRLVIVG